MSSISGVSSAASSSNQMLLASLQAQMTRYASVANGQNSQASADYKALQSYIKTGDASAAQAALARLQSDSQASASPSPAPASSAQNQISDNSNINTTA
ncbi:MAG TPA: hypothetical protein VGL42_14215 [Opitutaceae bacterium]|jgi:hypothetical protein